jgi:hypothetical protein
MIRRSSGMSVRRYSGDEHEDVNPLETVANLSDVMLVFAVALMLALVSRYSVNMAQTELDEEDLETVDQEEAEAVASDIAEGKGYEEVGTMYKDPDTGEVYVLSK